MTIRDLVERLREFPDDVPVHIESGGFETRICGIRRVLGQAYLPGVGWTSPPSPEESVVSVTLFGG
jgi:hypothetical protein